MIKQNNDKIMSKFELAFLLDQTAMPLITVYHDPADYPQKYVARLWDVNKPTCYVALADSLREVRAAIPAGMSNMGRSEQDDPSIVEVWL